MQVTQPDVDKGERECGDLNGGSEQVDVAPIIRQAQSL